MTSKAKTSTTAQRILRWFTTTTTSACALSRVAVYPIKGTRHSFNLVISRGSVVDFSYPPNPRSCAIVNAANEGCLGGGGVDGAISDAGGPNLLEDRKALPIVQDGDCVVRCRTGSAVITGPNSYSKLQVPYVIHAVGPNYMRYRETSEISEGDELLSSAYSSSLECGKNTNLEAIAFSLLSSGVFRGSKSVKEVLRTGVNAVCQFDGYNGLKEVHMCAFSQKEEDTLKEIAKEIGLKC